VRWRRTDLKRAIPTNLASSLTAARESLAITITTYQISDADVGTTIGPQNGFVAGLTMLSPPTVYEQPDRDPGRQLFKSGYFTIVASAT
jgi:hypothetical protein